MSLFGNRVLRTEDPKFLTVGGSYVYDLSIDGAAHLTYVRSTMAHARVTELDVAEAKLAPGVLDVVTAADVDVEPPAPEFNDAMPRPWLAGEVVNFVGEPVLAIVTETKAQGVDAAELAFVDYEALPVLIDPEEALRGDTLIHPGAGTNIATEFYHGEPEGLFDGCDVVVRQRMVNQRVAPCPLEVRSAAARWDTNPSGDQSLTFWSSTQAPHGVRDALATVFGLNEDRVRVIAPDVGGAFGCKISAFPDELLVAWLARRLHRPVVWTETRSESMIATGHGRAQIQDVEIGGTRDGRIEAYRLEVVQDAGAYASMGTFLPYMTRTMLTGSYDIERASFKSRSVVTNTTPTVAYRGAGRPEATAAIERIIDCFASEIGMDPAEVRRRNFVKTEDFPYTTAVGTVYDCGDYTRASDLLLESAGYGALRAEQAERRASGDVRQLGIGLSAYVEITNPVPGSEYASIEVREDGSVVVLTGTSPHGQGHATAWAMIASDVLGIPVESVQVLHGDTAAVPRGIGTFGSRSLQIGGVVVNEAGGALVSKARDLASKLLGTPPGDVVFDKVAGCFHPVGAPELAKTWTDVAATAGGSVSAECDFTPSGPTFPFGAHLAVVEVDTETGKVVLRRFVAVDDAGRILNPLLAEGQIHGGIAQGSAQALMEEVLYDTDGNPVTSNLADYAFISAPEVPSFETIQMETPTPINPLGAKGIGESGTIGSTPAVHNAVVDALSPFGVRHIDMPATPEKIWLAIRQAPVHKIDGGRR